MSDDQTVTPIKPKPEKLDRRHPLVVTSERLADHVEQYGQHITPYEIEHLTALTKIVDRIHLRVTQGED